MYGYGERRTRRRCRQVAANLFEPGRTIEIRQKPVVIRVGDGSPAELNLLETVVHR